MTAAALVGNGATFACSGDRMWAYRIPGAPDLPVPSAMIDPAERHREPRPATSHRIL